MTLDLSDSLVQAAEQQATLAGFSNVTEYITSLIRADQTRLAKEHVDRQLLAGLDSGEPKPMSTDDWLRVRAEVRDRHSARRGDAK